MWQEAANGNKTLRIGITGGGTDRPNAMMRHQNGRPAAPAAAGR